MTKLSIPVGDTHGLGMMYEELTLLAHDLKMFQKAVQLSGLEDEDTPKEIEEVAIQLEDMSTSINQILLHANYEGEEEEVVYGEWDEEDDEDEEYDDEEEGEDGEEEEGEDGEVQLEVTPLADEEGEGMDLDEGDEYDYEAEDEEFYDMADGMAAMEENAVDELDHDDADEDESSQVTVWDGVSDMIDGIFEDLLEVTEILQDITDNLEKTAGVDAKDK